MKYALLILFTFAVGLSQAQDDWFYQYKNGPKVDTVIKPYVDIFLAECKEAGVSTKKFYKLKSITFSTLPGTISGVCIPRHKKVYLDLSISNRYPSGIRLLVFHELGHCVLGLAHIPASSGMAIMNPALDFENLGKYYDNWEALLIMLFSDKHPNLKDTNDCCPDMIEDPCTYDD